MPIWTKIIRQNSASDMASDPSLPVGGNWTRAIPDCPGQGTKEVALMLKNVTLTLHPRALLEDMIDDFYTFDIVAHRMDPEHKLSRIYEVGERPNWLEGEIDEEPDLATNIWECPPALLTKKSSISSTSSRSNFPRHRQIILLSESKRRHGRRNKNKAKEQEQEEKRKKKQKNASDNAQKRARKKAIKVVKREAKEEAKEETHTPDKLQELKDVTSLQ
ncbi:hypothetical protein D6D01_06690 [Aureobasidium pullulans]|uniref:Uncharacterized protein n=1 Tax=Aureobasidium pullulans TaxID=5580 RepID=A0A4S9KXI3_AURPU|nr:hypothetical protein D6D01_06690 [Aureobasidium pullulans]